MKKTVLFVDQVHHFSFIAAQELAQRYNEGISVESAGITPQRRKTNHREGMGSIGIVSFDAQPVHCVVVIGKVPEAAGRLFPGLPPVFYWSDIDTEDDALYAESVATVCSRVAALVSTDCLSALLAGQSALGTIVDSLALGVIAHDLHRRVFMFSKGAERITGVPAEQVLGRDCHTLFTPRLCGEECVFCDDNQLADDAAAKYSVRLLAGKSGNPQLNITRTPLTGSNGETNGVLATFTDVTRVHDLERRLHETESFSGIIGGDERMVEIYELIRNCSDNDFPVVISGESGTGKELVAAAIHRESLRRDHLFVPVNCGALPEGTLESELFGHLRGSFTGAIRDKKGRFELADKGTLFLDEIGDLPLPLQVKLLRVLQDGVVEPVGSERFRTVDTRIICATNRNLREMVAKGSFREDLYYRIAVVPIEMPPLRERRNDIPALARFFLEKTTGRLSRGTVVFSEQVISMFLNYPWPGNVRQLQNAIQFALIKCRTETILPEHLPPEICAGSFVPAGVYHLPGKVGRKPKLSDDVVLRALEKSGGNKAKAARLLNVGRATLYNFIRSGEIISR